MSWPARKPALSLAVIVAALVVCAVPPARAEEASYCVTCKNPDQSYVCRVDAGGLKAGDALKLYCIIRIAKEGHHGSCAADNNASACNGVEKVYSYDGAIPPDIASDPRVERFVNKLQRNQQNFDDDKPQGDAPKTLVELTGRAVSASKKGLRNARSALGGSSSTDQPLPAGEPLSNDQSAASAENEPNASPDAPHLNRMQRAGSAVGGFARKSYHCVLSLFRNCSDDSADGGSVQ
jgi:hypothetical protein